MEGDGLWLRREGFEDLLQAAASKICRTRSCLSPPPLKSSCFGHR